MLLEPIIRCAIAFILVRLFPVSLVERTGRSRRGWVCARMRGITPARPQFETRPLLLDVIEVPRPLNKTGLYSREASIRGNTVILFVSALIASLRSSDDNYIPTPKGMAKVLINISFCWSCFCCCVCCSPRCRTKTMKVLILYSFMGFIYHTIMDAIPILFIKFLDLLQD